MFFFLVYTISILESEDIEISSITSFIKSGKSARRLSSYDSLSKDVTDFSSEEAEEDNSSELEN